MWSPTIEAEDTVKPPVSPFPCWVTNVEKRYCEPTRGAKLEMLMDETVKPPAFPFVFGINQLSSAFPFVFGINQLSSYERDYGQMYSMLPAIDFLTSGTQWYIKRIKILKTRKC